MADQIAGEPAGAARRGLNPKVKLAVLALVVVLAGAALAWFIHYQTVGKYLASTNDAYLRADVITVSPKVGGYVDRVFVAENQDVQAGQPLVRIDSRDYGAQAAQYRAQIGVAEANADNVRAGIAEQRAMVEQARAQRDASLADLRFAEEEVARYTPLAASGAESREKLAQLRNQATRARNEAAARAASLASAERRIASLNAQIRQAQAQGGAARAQLTAANVNLGATLVRAPAAGRIGDRTVRTGQFVQPGTRMMSVVPLAAIYVSANFKETQIGLMRPGQPATIEVDALPGVELHGHVESLSPGTGAQFSLIPPQNATGNFTKIVQRVPVRIAIDAGPEVRRILVPGLSLEVTVDTRGAKDEMSRITAREEQRR
ncbi:HlyD family secretion protein [Sphingomonas jatrophae]|uniref:Membrane fusion protein, multidrug efflux system n=1 Tax=Sphingomonas jatrophae TaxID=1166337 RepID=A0A1I6KJE3_9SPHN|nr:HlyD family secretion protein [Sphingomonas jatrophae]SFR91363.1 membrane fusion protein, multidrug efflux system [Sphingomonas jatrophae]